MLKVGTWEERTLDNSFGSKAFFPDGSMFATSPGQGVIQFLESSTGRVLARLELEDETVAGSMAFTPDGATMVVSRDYTHALNIWDLQAIRRQLAEIGLDWDAPPYPPAGESQPATRSLQVAVNLGNRFVTLDPRVSVGLSSLRIALNPLDFEAYLDRGRAYGRQKEPQKALADYTMALILAPEKHQIRGETLFRRSNNYRALNDLARTNADLEQLAELDLPLPEELQATAALQCNNLAWEYATGPEKQRDLKKALPLAQKAVKLEADGGSHLNTLGVVYYRLAQYPQAIGTLERSLHEQQGQSDAFDLFFLAMCHAQQGSADKAKDCYSRAVAWVQQNSTLIGTRRQWGEELKAFQAEAEELLKKMK
jgi:tetratricopeptide (TPR) repeat protein